MRPFRYATAALGCAALAVLAGCASVSPSGTETPGAGASGATAAGRLAGTTAATPVPDTAGAAVSAAGYGCPAPSPRKTPASRRLAARLRARVLLCDFTVPRGARRLDKTPSAQGKALAGHARGQAAAGPDFVAMYEWWLVPGKPAAVLAWEAGHVHGGLKGTGWEESSQPWGPYRWLDVFSPHAGPAWVAEQGLSLTVTAHGKNTALEADALVAWFPPALPARRSRQRPGPSRSPCHMHAAARSSRRSR